MTFDALERSLESGRPIEVYTISVGSSIFYYTSSEADQLVSGTNFIAQAITRTDVRQGAEERDATLTLTVPGGLPFISEWATGAPSTSTTVLIQRFHRGDAELITLFQGVVKAINWDGTTGQVAKIAVEPGISAITRPCPRYTYSGQCNHVLYDSQCTVDDTDPTFRASLEVTAAAGLELTVPGLAAYGDGWFDGGLVEIGTDARMVINQVGDTVTLHLPFNTSPVGAGAVVLAGCAHDFPTCVIKFNNGLNYGGHKDVPVLNIFETGVDPNLCN